MPRKGKEPAGLRRYRLAQKRKRGGSRTRRVRAPKRRRSYMARRKRRGGKKSKSIPLAMVIPPAYVVMNNISKFGYAGPSAVVDHISADMTGYQPSTGTFDYNWAKPFWMGELVGIVIHKVANKTGVNRHVKKLSMGYLTI